VDVALLYSDLQVGYCNVTCQLSPVRVVYTYKYTDGLDKLNETSLPPNEEFYSSLKEEDIKDPNYEHSKYVWSHIGCQTLGDYSD